VQLDAIEAGVERPLGCDAELLDDARDLVNLERAMRRRRHEAVLGYGHPVEWDPGGGERGDAPGHFDMALAAAVDDPHEGEAALGVDSIGDRLPAFNLAVVIEARRPQVRTGGDGDADTFDDFEAALRGALAIEVGHHRARDVARLDGAHAGHRRQHDAMRQGIAADLGGREQFRHNGLRVFERKLGCGLAVQAVADGVLIGRPPVSFSGEHVMIEFKGSHFERDVILWAVRWYVAYPISYRQLEEMMEEHGVAVD
jgi:hypothetical protein